MTRTDLKLIMLTLVELNLPGARAERSPPPPPPERREHISIAAGPVRKTLIYFGFLVYPGPVASTSERTLAVDCYCTVSEALNIMLAGSRLKSWRSDDGNYYVAINYEYCWPELPPDSAPLPPCRPYRDSRPL